MENNYLAIQLFVSSDDPTSETVAQALQEWGRARSDCRIEVIPVLSRPEDVVRLMIMKTPALVLDGRLIAGGIRSGEELADLLPV